METTNHSSSREQYISILDDEEAQHIFARLKAEVSQNSSMKDFMMKPKKLWTKDEIRMLEYAVTAYAKKKDILPSQLSMHDWKYIADLVPGRTESQCQYKWSLTQRDKPLKKFSWKPEEDKVRFEYSANVAIY